MENLVADLYICQEAFKKGIKIESVYKWAEIVGVMTIVCGVGYEDSVSAPLTDEILQVLPKNILKNSKTYWLTIDKAGDCFNAYYKNDETLERNPRFNDKKLSNALLLLAIELKKEGII
jgi:hypothetical protein